jgi:hypothetical protein
MAQTVSAAASETTAPAARPTLFTRAFVIVALAELAYFTADGMLLPALPRYVEGSLGRNIAVGLGSARSACRPSSRVPGPAGRRSKRATLPMVAGVPVCVSVTGYFWRHQGAGSVRL